MGYEPAQPIRRRLQPYNLHPFFDSQLLLHHNRAEDEQHTRQKGEYKDDSEENGRKGATQISVVRLRGRVVRRECTLSSRNPLKHKPKCKLI